MEKHAVAPVSEIPPGARKLVTVKGRAIAIFNIKGEYFGLFNRCPHQGGSLCDGMVEGDIVICPLHGWEFDLRSGACMTVPGESVPRFTVTVEDGAVHLEEAS